MSNKLKAITYEVMKKLKSQEIILPSDYSKIFQKCAKELKYNLENEEVILKDINQDINKIDQIVEQTNKNLTSLDNSTKGAQKAIKNKNEKELKSIQNDLELMKSEIEFLQKELFSDTLTKAYNRKWLNDVYLKDDKFQGNGYLAFIDLNNFKSINDNYGHIVGDMVLKYLTNYLNKEIILENKYVIRYAGDEFILIVNEKIAFKELEKILNDVQASLLKQKLRIKNSKNIEFSFGFSYGLVEYKNNNIFEDIINIADEKMYKNKILIKSKK